MGWVGCGRGRREWGNRALRAWITTAEREEWDEAWSDDQQADIRRRLLEEELCAREVDGEQSDCQSPYAWCAHKS